MLEVKDWLVTTIQQMDRHTALIHTDRGLKTVVNPLEQARAYAIEITALLERDPLLVQQVTEERVAAHFAHRKPTRVTRYLLPNIAAMNFVLDDVLDGGVNDSLNLDMHGKALSFHLLTLAVQAPAGAAQATMVQETI